MEQIAEILISGLLVCAGVFGLVGSFGLMKLPDTMTRLHAPTKATTLGVGSVLMASMCYQWVFEANYSLHEILITMFLLLTAPITANFIAKAYMHRANLEPELPQDPGGQEWASFAEQAKPMEPRMTETPGR